MTAPVAAPRRDRAVEQGFLTLARLVERETGIKLPPNKRVMLEGRLRPRLRVHGLEGIDDYYHLLFDRDGLKTEFPYIIDAVTTNKTDFFREALHFDLLAGEVVPEVMASGGVERRPLMAWSAACSTGAEAYTMAMVLADLAQAGRGPDFLIQATDICTDVLRTATRAIYREEDIQPVPLALRHKYLLRSKDPGRRVVRVVPSLRSRVRVERHNLMDARYPWPGAMDIIFCRNVLIYFSRDVQAAVLARLCACLRPGGYLFVGHSETLNGMTLPVRMAGPSLYRRL